MHRAELPALPLVLLVAVAAGGCAATGGHLFASPNDAASAKPSGTLSRQGRAALRALIEAGAHPDLDWPELGASRDAVRRVYRSIRHGLAWSTGSRISAQARALAELLRDAERRGLDPSDYDGKAWEARLETLERPEPPPSESEWIRFDVAMTVSAVRFVSDLRFGRTPPRSSAARDERVVDVASIVASLLGSEDVFRVVESLEPPFPEYRRTRAALAAYLERARDDDGEPLPAPEGPAAIGDAYPGVPRLARLLRTVGDLPWETILGSEDRYDMQLADAVARFQRRHGLVPDGRLDARTVRVLNVPLAHRVSQLKLTLERWRSLPRDRGLPEIVVNVPEFRLRAGDAEHPLSMNVVVGSRRENETPVFFSDVTEIVFRPSWNVPLRIQRCELVPRLRRNPGLLAKEGYELVDPAGNVVEAAVSAAMILRLRAGSLPLRQRPGERSALGRAKFVVPNDFNVALHGTTRKRQFAMSRRALSRGACGVGAPGRSRLGSRAHPSRDGRGRDGRCEARASYPDPRLLRDRVRGRGGRRALR